MNEHETARPAADPDLQLALARIVAGPARTELDLSVQDAAWWMLSVPRPRADLPARIERVIEDFAVTGGMAISLGDVGDIDRELLKLLALRVMARCAPDGVTLGEFLAEEPGRARDLLRRVGVAFRERLVRRDPVQDAKDDASILRMADRDEEDRSRIGRNESLNLVARSRGYRSWHAMLPALEREAAEIGTEGPDESVRRLCAEMRLLGYSAVTFFAARDAPGGFRGHLDALRAATIGAASDERVVSDAEPTCHDGSGRGPGLADIPWYGQGGTEMTVRFDRPEAAAADLAEAFGWSSRTGNEPSGR